MYFLPEGILGAFFIKVTKGLSKFTIPIAIKILNAGANNMVNRTMEEAKYNVVKPKVIMKKFRLVKSLIAKNKPTAKKSTPTP